MKQKSFIKGTAIGFVLSTTILFGMTVFADKYDFIDKKIEVIEKTLDKYYVGELDKTAMEEGIYKGLVSSVGDPYTTYYTKEEFDSIMEKTSGVYAGIGVQMMVDQTDNTILVTDVFEGSPAEKAGMLSKDKIVGAEGQPLTGDDFNEAPKIIKGKPGTKVTVTVFRPSTNETLDLEMKRENVIYPSVSHKMLEGDINYIKISSFEELTYDQFKEALDEGTKANAEGLIIDLRDNTGGLLDVTVQIVDELIPEGVIVSTKDKNGKVKEMTSDDQYVDIPIVVLVNERSASASEVLSGALKDHNRAILVGNRTFGKGIVQTIMPLTDGSAIKVTTSQYFTPSGVCIQGEGIEPDYKVDLVPELMIKAKLEYNEDLQLQKAVEVLREQIQ
ncbi:MAG: S41 family peptidase [Clostridiales bacterium]|uniref:S41 family peptidase n=1 Tax=Zhenhengia sp. TaxID=2944208 RepID=UPI00290A3FDA|nr:S41 family peptidase [Clostridiales bacterium]